MSTAYRTTAYSPAVAFKAETLSPQGIFNGYAAVFGNLDGNGDVIDYGAFAETLADANARSFKAQPLGGARVLWPMLWQHDEHEPIGGVIGAREDAKGLHITGKLDLNSARGQQAYSGMSSGYLKGLSIGYATKVAASGSPRHLKKIQLFEVSPVTFPANDLAQVDEVKARLRQNGAATDWETQLELNKLLADMARQMMRSERQAAIDAAVAKVDALMARLR